MENKLITDTKSEDNGVLDNENCLESNTNNYSNLLNSVESMDFNKVTIDSVMLSSSFGGNMRSSSSIIDLGKSLLRYAKENNFKGIQQMINKGAPFSTDWLGMQAIHFTALSNNYEACELLLRAGINKDAKTKVDRSPLHFAVFYGNQKIAQLLLSNNCAVNCRDLLRMTPLHWAVELGHKEIVTLLLEHNADVTAISKFGKTPIAIAVQTEQADLLEQLQHAKKQQEFQKYNDQQQKEMNEAINSITELTDNLAPLVTTTILSDDVTISEDTHSYIEDPIDQLKDINSKRKPLDKTAIDILKSHGISMMQDDDPSNNLLTTALKNGRQLVVSEGGKMLLNDVNVNNNNSNKHLSPSNFHATTRTDIFNKNPALIENQSKTDSNLERLKTSSTKPAINTKKVLKLISMQELRKMCGPNKINSIKASPCGNTISKIKKTNVIPMTGKRVFLNFKNNSTYQNLSNSTPDEGSIKLTDFIDDIDLSGNIISKDSDCDSFTTSYNEISESKSNFNNHQSGSSYNQPTIPILTLHDVSENMIQMKKQIEDLQQRYESLQKENLHFRTRINHLESIIKSTDISDDYVSCNVNNTIE